MLSFKEVESSSQKTLDQVIIFTFVIVNQVRSCHSESRSHRDVDTEKMFDTPFLRGSISDREDYWFINGYQRLYLSLAVPGSAQKLNEFNEFNECH